MSDIKCHIIEDLIPLYADDVLSSETANDVKSHLKYCDNCNKYLDLYKCDSKLEIETLDDKLEDNGEIILKKIKKSQDRLKYTFIIFSIIVAVASCIINSGIISTIPLIIIIPFIIRLFFKENKVVFITAIATLLISGLIVGDFGYIVFLSPLVLICITCGLVLGSTLKSIIDWRRYYEK